MGKVRFIIVTLLILLLTLLRENVFVALNAVIAQIDYNTAYFYLLDEFFMKFSIESLRILKWYLTFFFSLSITSLSILGVNLWFKSKIFTLIITKMYLFVFLFVLIIGFVLFIFNIYETYYFVLRKLAGLIQSPIPFLLMFTVFYYLKIENSD